MKKTLVLIAMLSLAFAMQAQKSGLDMSATTPSNDQESMDEMELQNLDDEEYVDLGLPSGTKWPRSHYTVVCFDDDIPDNTPTIEQWFELYDKCEWKWRRCRKLPCNECAGDWEITGPNGNKIWIRNIGDEQCPYKDMDGNGSDLYKIYTEARGPIKAYTNDGTIDNFCNHDKGYTNYGIIFRCKPQQYEKRKHYYVAIMSKRGFRYLWPQVYRTSKGIEYGYIEVEHTLSYLDGKPCGVGKIESYRLITVSK